MSYKEGIIKAIEEFKDRNGSSMIAIKKHMQAGLPADKKWMNATFLASLKAGVTNGEFVQIKNSYKLSPDFKKKRADASKPKAKKPAAKKVVKKVAPKKKTAPKKKAATKKTATKKTVKKTAVKKTSAKKATGKKTVKKAVKKTSAKKTSTKKKATEKQ